MLRVFGMVVSCRELQMADFLPLVHLQVQLEAQLRDQSSATVQATRHSRIQQTKGEMRKTNLNVALINHIATLKLGSKIIYIYTYVRS